MSFRNDDDFDAQSYVKVNVRLKQFWEKYPEGRVETNCHQYDNQLTFTARLFRKQEDVSPASTGHAFSELNGEKVGEYTETVAVGRALALMGFSVEKSIASAEEMKKWHETQQAKTEKKDAAPAAPAPRQSKIKPASKPAEKSQADKAFDQPNHGHTEAPAPAQAAPEQKTEQKAEPAPASAPAETKEQEVAKQVADAPKTLKASRIFKPLPKPAATQGASNG